MTPIFTIRPAVRSRDTTAVARKFELEVTPMPMFDICPVAWDPPPASDFDALLLGSANAVRFGGEGLRAYARLPVHAVGGASAKAAVKAGLRVEREGKKSMQHLLDEVIGPIRYLRPMGRDHVELDAPHAISITGVVVYESVALPMPQEMADALAGGALVLVHSAVAATHLREECDRLGVDRSQVRLATLAARISEAAGEGWQEVRHPQHVHQGALLSLAADMCH